MGLDKKTVGKINVRTKIYEYPHKSSAQHICQSGFLKNDTETWEKVDREISGTYPGISEGKGGFFVF